LTLTDGLWCGVGLGRGLRESLVMLVAYTVDGGSDPMHLQCLQSTIHVSVHGQVRGG
jgi:hypothetical protein